MWKKIINDIKKAKFVRLFIDTSFREIRETGSPVTAQHKTNSEGDGGNVVAGVVCFAQLSLADQGNDCPVP